MPHEHEIPAPVTTTIFFDFATARDISERERLVEELVLAASRSRVTVIVVGASHSCELNFDVQPTMSTPL
jgi:hypothetical protein